MQKNFFFYLTLDLALLFKGNCFLKNFYPRSISLTFCKLYVKLYIGIEYNYESYKTQRCKDMQKSVFFSNVTLIRNELAL